MPSMLANLLSGQTVGGLLGKFLAWAAARTEESPKKGAWTTVIASVGALFGLRPDWLERAGAGLVGLGQWLGAIAQAMQ